MINKPAPRAVGASQRQGWREWAVHCAPVSLFLSIAATPAWANASSMFGFEPDKVWLLVVLLSSGLGLAIATFDFSSASLNFRLPRRPFSLLLIAALLSVGLSTVFSIQPARAWWGSPHRAQGMLFTLALLAACYLTWTALREPDGRVLLPRLIVLSSIPILAVALAQRTGGRLPGLWGGDPFAGRPFSTLGNPVFLGGYLLFAVLFTSAELVSSLRERRRGALAGRVAVGLLLAGQLVVLYWTHARGAWLGLFFALLCMAWGVARSRLHRAAPVLAGLLVAALTLVVFFTSIVSASSGQVASFFGSAADPTGSGRQRVAIWEAVLDRWTSGAISIPRLLTGYGPDAGDLILPGRLAYQPPDSGDDTRLLLDRAHNLTLDAWLTTGLIGWLVQIGLFGVAVRAGLQRMGCQPAWSRLACGGLAGMGLLGALGSLLSGRGALVPLGLGLGLVGGLIVGASVGGRPSLYEISDDRQSHWLIAAALGAVVGHWVDLQFSFETPAAGLLYWVCLAILTFPAPVQGEGASHPQMNLTICALAAGAMLLAVIMTLRPEEVQNAFLWLCVPWVASGGLLLAWYSRQAIRLYPLLSLTPTLFVGMFSILTNRLEAGVVVPTLTSWVVLILGVCLAGWAVRPAGPRCQLVNDQARFWRFVLPLAGTGVALLGVGMAARLAAGDLLTARGMALAAAGEQNTALSVLWNARAFGPHDDMTHDAIAQSWLAEARRASTPADADVAYAQAAEAMRNAWQAVPAQYAYGRRLSAILREWAMSPADAAGRVTYLQQAVEILQSVQAIAPTERSIARDLHDLQVLLAYER